MTKVPDLFNEAVRGRGGVPRDGWGRALLRPRGVSVEVPYTAASSLAEYVANHRAIHRWRMRYLAVGLSRRPDLAAMAAAEIYNTGFDKPDEGENRDSGRRLDEIIEEAIRYAGAEERANHGTAVHRYTEPGVVEANGGYVPEEMRADVESWWRAARGFRIVATELFVVCDELMAAGTLDHIVEMPGFDELLVLDKKTGRKSRAAIQLSTYANSEIYDRDTHERVSFEERFGREVSREIAIYADIPARKGETILDPIDVRQGFEDARLAMGVREYQSRQRDVALEPLDLASLARQRAAQLLREAQGSVATMRAIRERYEDVWTDELQRLGKELIDARQRP